jgi:hypothetical protein
MTRCIAIHSNGTSEVLDFQPQLHQKLRGLGYRRFVVEGIRVTDGRSLTTSLYAKGTPSGWQIADSAKKVWGRGTGVLRVFDENGELLPDDSDASARSTTIEPRADQTPLADARPTPAIGVVQQASASAASVPVEQLPELITRANRLLPDSDPRKLTLAMVADLRRAARELRLGLDEGRYARGDEIEQRALADRLETYAHALESYLPART